jgi:RNA polymerase-binding transcription factor DksA
MDANADDEHDPEGSTVAFERAKVIALKSEAESHLAALERALERLSSAEYAVCQRCRREIPAERLAARPATTICVECAGSHPSASGLSSS